MKKITLIVILILYVSLLAYATPTDKLIGYRGYLEEFNSIVGAYQPVTGNRDFRFTISRWDVPTSTWVQVWQEEHKQADGFAISVVNGQFSVNVGSRVAFDDPSSTLDFSSDVEYSLRVEVKKPADATYGDFLGMKRILFVPYSFEADNVLTETEVGAMIADSILTEAEVEAMVFDGDSATVIEVRTSDPPAPVTGRIWLLE